MASIELEPRLVASSVFVAERYVSGTDLRHVSALARLFQEADGSSRLRHALYLPVDETYFAVYDRLPPDGAGQRAGPLDRVVRAVLLEPHQSWTRS